MEAKRNAIASLLVGFISSPIVYFHDQLNLSIFCPDILKLTIKSEDSIFKQRTNRVKRPISHQELVCTILRMLCWPHSRAGSPGQIRIRSDTSGRAKSIRKRYAWTRKLESAKKTFADSNVSGYGWTGPQLLGRYTGEEVITTD